MVEKFYLYRVKLTNTPIMRRIFYLLFLVLLGYSFDVKASDTVFIHETQIPGFDRAAGQCSVLYPVGCKGKQDAR